MTGRSAPRWTVAPAVRPRDTVEAAWKIVDPVLGDVGASPLRQGQLGSPEADRLLLTATPGDPWPR